jgi:methionyl-tRNA formyltransferase
MSIDPQKVRIVFFGTPAFTIPVLQALAATYTVIGVVTASDKPVGRKAIITSSPIKAAAQELGIPVISIEAIDDLKPDLCVVAAYNKILPAHALGVPRLGFLNIHPSLLPLYRGASPVRSAILDGQNQTGVSIMLLDAAMDHGPLLAQEGWTIPDDMSAAAAEDALFVLGTELLMRTLPNYIAGTLVPQPQDHARATYTKKFTREDGHLDWSQPASRIHDRIRALADNPGTWTTWHGKMLNIRKAHLSSQGTLEIQELQLEGGKPQTMHDFLNGHPQFDPADLV